MRDTGHRPARGGPQPQRPLRLQGGRQERARSAAAPGGDHPRQLWCDQPGRVEPRYLLKIPEEVECRSPHWGLRLFVWVALESLIPRARVWRFALHAIVQNHNIWKIDTTLIPSGTQNGATQGKAEKGNGLIYAGFASSCKPLQRLTAHS